MNKFAEWMKNNDRKQSGVAKKLGISTTTIHQILKQGQLPSLRLAYEIEQYTKGAVTLYDWIDYPMQDDNAIAPKSKAKKINT